MSRLESNPVPNFEIAQEHAEPAELFAVPLSLRKEAIDKFDREFILDKPSRPVQEATRPAEMAEYLSNARLLFKEKEFSIAQDMYRAVLKIDSQNEIAIRGLSECAKALFEHDEALRVLKRLVQNKGSATHYKLLGDQLYHMNYNEDAIEAYVRALSYETADAYEHFDILKNCGNILLRLGDPDGAEEYYNKAFTISPDSDVLLVNFGSLALYRGEYNVALSRFREAVSLNDKNDKAWAGLAMIHREYGDSELAWANVEKALDINPGNESAIKLVADWALKDNEIDKAIFRLEGHLAVSGEDAIIWMWLSKFYFFSGRLDLAKENVERALRLDPEVDGGRDVLTVIRDEIQTREARAK
ncbi:MAG: tetratricopeptide repeat protein [Bdellovibrionales bacterium]|nr:tetratricopeptide repeat protein [Bdellovibrionales bacterium]